MTRPNIPRIAMATVLSQELRRAAGLCVELWSFLAGFIHHGKKIGQCLLALGEVRRSRSKRFQSTIDGLVDGVPIRRGTRLQARLCLVPRRLKVFDARLCGREVTLVSQGFCVDHDRPELRKITEFGGRRGLYRRDHCQVTYWLDARTKQRHRKNYRRQDRDTKLPMHGHASSPL